jgi:hypothetical protein
MTTPFVRALVLLVLCFTSSHLLAADKHDAERAARVAAGPLEKLGFVFRADSWTRDLRPDVGKAVRVQLFKGLEYRFVVALPPGAGSVVGGAVLDFEGKVASTQVGGEGEAASVVLAIKPKRSGVYVIAVHQGAAGKAVPCCILTGYK